MSLVTLQAPLRSLTATIINEWKACASKIAGGKPRKAQAEACAPASHAYAINGRAWNGGFGAATGSPIQDTDSELLNAEFNPLLILPVYHYMNLVFTPILAPG